MALETRTGGADRRRDHDSQRHGHDHHHGHQHGPGDSELTLTPAEQAQVLAWSAGLFVLGWFFELFLDNPQMANIAFYGALAAAAWTFVPDVVAKPYSVATLMLVGAVGAAALNAVHEGATLALLFAVSEAVVHRTFDRTRADLRGLLDLVPHQVSVLRDGIEVLVEPERLARGDVMVIRPGERLATDGVVVSGSSAVDLSAVTGEPVPVEVHAGSVVYAAGVNGGGALTVEVSTPSAESSLTRLVALLEEAQENRGSSEALVDRAATFLIGGAAVVAAGTFAFGVVTGDVSTWTYRALMVLVAMSPCALAIAIPVTVLSSIGTAGRAGILLKGGAVLEALARTEVCALDKTGTLTGRDPRVLEVVAAPNPGGPALPGHEILAVAGALEARSEHPLAGAILAAVPGVRAADDVEAVPGRGLVGRLDGVRLRLGNPGFVDPGPLASEVDRLQRAGATVVVVERAGAVVGLVAVRDELRPEAAEAVAGLRKAGHGHVAMLTGDNRRAAETLGSACGVDEVQAELLPADKVDAVHRLEARGPVLMVGDGINDAPALAAAHVGVAMGAMGTDLAVEAADAALLGNDLRQLGGLVGFARRSQRIVRQQLVLSALVVAGLVPLAVTGTVKLAVAVLVHELTGTLIVLSGLRAGRAGLLAPGGVPKESSPAPGVTAGRRSSFTPRRAALALVVAAAVLSVAGVWHFRKNAPDAYSPWVRSAKPVLDEAGRIDSDNIILGEGSDYTIDCERARRTVDEVEPKMPAAPDATLQGIVDEMFTEMRRQYDTCLDGDGEASNDASDAAAAAAERIREYTILKTDGAHAH